MNFCGSQSGEATRERDSFSSPPPPPPPPSPCAIMAFRRGDKVEVASKQDGFIGSYYSARIISELADGRYVVKYRRLWEEDESHFLVEIVDADEVRPVPPLETEKDSRRFSLNDYVDAYDRDGWWVGRVVGKVGIDYYTVYFDTTGDRINYPLERLRAHLEWAQSGGNHDDDSSWDWWHVHPSSASLSTPPPPEDHTKRRRQTFRRRCCF